jgi:hypothetical protein
MWIALARSSSVAAAFEQLLHEVDVAPDQLGDDLRCLVEKLQEHGLIEISAATLPGNLKSAAQTWQNP